MKKYLWDVLVEELEKHLLVYGRIEDTYCEYVLTEDGLSIALDASLLNLADEYNHAIDVQDMRVVCPDGETACYHLYWIEDGSHFDLVFFTNIYSTEFTGEEEEDE